MIASETSLGGSGQGSNGRPARQSHLIRLPSPSTYAFAVIATAVSVIATTVSERVGVRTRVQEQGRHGAGPAPCLRPPPADCRGSRAQLDATACRPCLAPVRSEC